MITDHISSYDVITNHNAAGCMGNGNLGAEGNARPKKPIIPEVRLGASGSQN